MALIKCKECGHEVSDKASACPNCGCPVEEDMYAKSVEVANKTSLWNEITKLKIEMKKYYSVLLMLAMMGAALSITACGDDDEDSVGASSELVGTWDIVSNVQYYSDYPPEYDEVNGAYWVFTSTQIEVHDPTDLLNGRGVDYTYNSSTKELKVVGWPIYIVLELTSTTLKMQSVIIQGSYNIITLKKR